jgi:Protein of unknown function (DUF2568)
VPAAALRSLILAVHFLLELCALAAIGYWGFRTAEGAMKWVLGIGTPLAAVLWAMFVAPGSTAPVALRVAVVVAVFGSAAAALYVREHGGLALIFVVVVIVNPILDLVSA